MTLAPETTATPKAAAPSAAVRSRVVVPLRFPDGFEAVADVLSFSGLTDGKEHLLLALGEWEAALQGAAQGGAGPLVRLHSECLTGDVFGSQRCDCGPQLREAVERIAAEGGFLLYLRQEGRGIGLYSKLDAYALQDGGLDTYAANLALGHGEDERDYTAAAQMLEAMGAGTLRLLSNNPDKAAQLTGLGLEVSGQVATGVHASAANLRYLAAKRDHTGHTLVLPSDAGPVAGAPGALAPGGAPGDVGAASRAGAGRRRPSRPMTTCSPGSRGSCPACASGPRKPRSSGAFRTPRWRSCTRPKSSTCSPRRASGGFGMGAGNLRGGGAPACPGVRLHGVERRPSDRTCLDARAVAAGGAGRGLRERAGSLGGRYRGAGRSGQESARRLLHLGPVDLCLRGHACPVGAARRAARRRAPAVPGAAGRRRAPRRVADGRPAGYREQRHSGRGPVRPGASDSGLGTPGRGNQSGEPAPSRIR